MAEKREELHYDNEELAEYFAGDMPEDEAAALEAHLGGCPHCRTEALRISERSAAWFSWTPEAHQAAVAATATPGGAERAPRRGVWAYFWPGLAAVGAVASLILVVANVQRGRLLENESQRLATADQAAASAGERARQLEKELSDLRGRISRLPEIPPKSVSPGGRGPVETPVSIADARPAISLEAGTLGPAATKSQTATISAAAPSVRVRVTLPEVSANAIIDATLAEGDWHAERRGLAIQSEGATRFVVMVFTPEEVRRLLNRPTQLTLTNRGRATIGTVILTLRLE